MTAPSEPQRGDIEGPVGSAPGSALRRGADHYLLLMIVAFVVAVVATRGYLQATGYPQVGGGELHIAHMLWGGLLLVMAALLPLVVAASWVLTVSAIFAGAGTGLFIDEVGKFITTSNDYFYPLAAPLIYGLLLALVLVYVLLRGRSGATTTRVPTSSGWEAAHLPRRRLRRLLIVGLLWFGIGWVLSLVVFLVLDPATVRDLIAGVVNVPGDRVERPTEPLFYWLEAAILGASGIVLVVAAALLGTGRERWGAILAMIGLGVALTAGAIVSLYVEQISAMLSTLLHAALLVGVVHYRNRYLVLRVGEPV